MQQQSRQAQRSRVFLWLGLLGIAVAIVGFAKTFFAPLLSGTFAAPAVTYVHAAILFGWVGFFATQSVWVHQRNLRRHRQMGWAGGVLAGGVVISTLAIATMVHARTTASAGADLANRELFVVVLEMTVFAALIAGALVLRRRPDVHKRLMLLALIASLGPAWFRFRHYFPPIDNAVFVYSLLLADSLIVIAALVDFIRERRVHWVYAVVGAAMVCVHLVEVFAFDAPWFGVVAGFAAGPFT